jgi:tRNA A-37 threonylcarbamoyl transferase component Bud32
MTTHIHQWRVVRGTPDAVAERILSDVPAAMTAPDAVQFRAGKTRVTALLPDVQIVVKWTRRMRTRAKLAALRAPTAAAVEFDLTEQACRAGIPTTKPLFAAERGIGPVVRQQVIAFAFVPGGESLEALVDLRCGTDPQRHDDLLARWGALLARAHDAGLAHCDATADNVLVTSDHDLTLLDWGRGVRIEPDDTTARRADAAGALANLHLLGVPASGLLAFFHAWCPEGQRHAAARHVIAYLHRKIPRLVRRTWEKALSPRSRLTRRTGAMLCLKRVTPEDIAAAEAVATDAAVDAWRVSCVAERFRLPVRPALAIDQSENRLLLPRSHAAPSTGDPAELIGLLARYGLRITDPSAIVHAPDDPLTTRSAGLRLDDPSALEFIAP